MKKHSASPTAVLNKRIKEARELQRRAQGVRDFANHLDSQAEELLDGIQNQIREGVSTGDPHLDCRIEYERDVNPPSMRRLPRRA